MFRPWASAALCLLLVDACKRDPAPGAGAKASASLRVPAPNSPLARELGADDAGRGQYRLYDDGPWCAQAPRVDRRKRLGATTATDAASAAHPDEAYLGFFETERAPADGPRNEAIWVMHKLTLRGPKRVVAEQAFPISITLANDSTTELLYSKAVDGSFAHWRSPFADLYARDEATGRTYRWTHAATGGYCGNVNARTKDDRVHLAPGQKKADPFGEWAPNTPTITKPGRYTLWVVYAACTGAELGLPLGVDEPAPKELFEGTLVSNGITVEIDPRP